MDEMSNDFRWFIDNALVPENHGTNLVMRSIRRAKNQKIVKCEVNNDIGKSEETETLEVNCQKSLLST